MEIHIKKISKLNKILMYCLPIGMSLASLVSGYFMVYLTMIEDEICVYNGISAEYIDIEFTLITAALPLGAIVGSLFINKLTNRFGENSLMILLNLMAILAIIIQMISLFTPILCISRLMMGFYCAMAFGIIPKFIVSISPNLISGVLGTFNQISFTLGIVFAYYMGHFTQGDTFTKETEISIYIGIPLVCVITNLIILYIFPYDNIERHIKNRQINQIKKYLGLLYGQSWKKVEEQIRIYKTIPSNFKFASEQTFCDNKNQENNINKCPRFNFYFLGILLAATNQLTGISAILQYAKQLFMIIQDGNEHQADLNVLSLGVFQFSITVGSGYLINRYGRRRMMLIGQAITVVALFLGFFVDVISKGSENTMIGVIFLHVLGCSISSGPICMLYAVEALQNLQPVILMIWSLSLIVTIVSDFMIDDLGIGIAFLIFGLLSTVCWILLYQRMYETKDRPRKEIWEMIEGGKIIWENSVRPQKLEDRVEKSLGTI